MKKRIRRQFLLLGLAALLIALAACSGQDKPPDRAEPWPEPHSGVFRSDYGTLRFNGDGQSVALDLGPELAAAIGLPEGESEGTYVFLFSNGSWRYDKAESLRITVDGQASLLSNQPGETDADHIVIYCGELSGGTVVRFTREANQ